MRLAGSVVALLVLAAPAAFAQVVVNEVHYNPPGSDGTVLLEFIEIHNADTVAVDVSGWKLRFGPEDFVFPAGSVLSAGSYTVVAENRSSLQAATGHNAAFEWFGLSVGLDNGDDEISLLTAGEVLVDLVHYDDDPPWPTAPDGNGPSLERTHPSVGGTQASGWRPSLGTNGTPGAQNSTYTAAATVLSQTPRVRSAVETLSSVELTFTASVTGVVAGDLTVDGSPATSVTGSGAGPYEFGGFAAPAPGSTTIAIGPGAIESAGVPFEGESWTISVGLVIVLNELHYHPPDAQADAEFIEIHNAGTSSADMSGWTISDGLDAALPPGTMLDPGEFLVLALDPSILLAETGYAGALAWSSGRLSNGGERLALADASGNELDVVDFADGGTWPSAPDGDGPSLELIHPRLPNQFGQSWAGSLAAHGTPGAQNSAFQAAPAPILADVRHDPPIPGAGQPVTITAFAIDDAGVPTVTLHHRQDQEPTLAYSSVLMADDGASGDGAAGDGVYGAILAGLAEGQRLDFAVTASDGSTSSIAPAGHGGSFAAGSHPPQTFLCKFSSAPVSTQYPHYHMITTQFTRNLQNTRNEVEYDATFVHCPQGGVVADCEVFYNVIERYRGASSLNENPPSFRVDFSGAQPLASELGFDMTSLNLMGRRPARQTIGYGMFDATGAPTPRNQLVMFNTNPLSHGGSQDYVYVNVERIDEDFFESQDGQLVPTRYPDRCDASDLVCDDDQDCPPGESCVTTDGGAAYRGRHDDSSLRWEGFDPNAYRVDANERNGYQQVTNEDADDWTDLINLCDAMNCSTSDGGVLCLENHYDGWFQEHLEDYADVDQWARWFAMHMLLNNTEGGIYRDTGDDYFLYFRDTQDHATFLPWDMDAIIPSFQETRTGASNPNWPVRRFLRNDAYAGRFVGAICEYMDTIFTQTAMDARIDALPDVLFTQPQDPPQGSGPTTKQGMKDWVAARRTFVANEIRRQTTLTGVPASPYTDPDPVISLSGQLNQCGARRVVVNGLEADSYTIANPGGVGASWSHEYTLVAGNNNIVVETLDHDGNVIDSASASVQYQPPGSGGTPDHLRVTMPTRMVNTKTLTLRADILDALGDVHWKTWTAVGTVSARRVSDQVAVPISVTVFETNPNGTGGGGPGADQIRFYNGVGSVSITLDNPASVAGQTIEVEVSVLGLTGSRVVTVLDEAAPGSFTNVSGALAGAVTWGPADGVIRITGNVSVGSGATLTLEPGTLVMVDAGPANNGFGINLSGTGSMHVNGTEAEPVMLFPTGGAAALVLPQTQQNNHAAWRGIDHQGSGSSTYSWMFVAGAGNGPTGSHPRSGVLRVDGTHSVTLDDCVLADSPGKGLFVLGNNDVTVRRNAWSRVGYGGEFLGGGHTLLVEDSWFTRMGYGPESLDLDGDIFHLDNPSSTQTIRRSVLADCGDDMMDHSGANPVVENTLIWDADDKCVSLSAGGSITFTNVLVFGMPLGVNGAGGILTHVTIATSSTPMGPPISVDRSIVWPHGMNTGACNGNIDYTLAGNTGHVSCGTGNLSANPLFQDPANRDYSLQAGSPAATAGPTGGRIGWLGFPEGEVCLLAGDCDDGNPCTIDVCDAGACESTPISGCTPCTVPGDCDDGNPCTTDACTSGTCSNPAGNDGGSCDDDQSCTSNDECIGGSCVGTEDCPFGLACDLAGECSPAPATSTFRNDGTYAGTHDTFLRQADPTTAHGALEAWEWDGEDPAPNVNQGLIRFDAIFGPGAGQVPPEATILGATLTLVVFDPSAAAAGSVHAALATWDEATTSWNTLGATPGSSAGEDHDPASVAAAPTATGTAVLDVTSSVQAWAADPSTNHGWVFVPGPGSTDGVQVRSSEHGVIAERPLLTVDWQLPGCDDDGDCDDGLGCNGIEICDVGTNSCLPGTPVVCDDGVGCTTDTCIDPAGTCQYAVVHATCEDGNPCTDDVCDPVLDCQSTDNADPCDDGDACTTNDTCSTGSCQPGGPLDCDDGTVCTDDSCDPIAGCEHADNCPAGQSCDLGVPGECVSGPQPGDLIIAGFNPNTEPEFIEIFNTSNVALSLEGLELIARVDVDPGDGVVDVDWELVADLTGATIAPHGFFLIAEAGVTPGPPDVATTINLASGEGGSAERAIGLELALDGVHMDHVLYGRHDGSTPAGEIPPGDIPFGGFPGERTEVIRTVTGTQPIASFGEGVTQRLGADALYAGHAVEGFYTDESSLPGSYPDGVWTSLHAATGAYTARSSSTPPVDPPASPVTVVAVGPRYLAVTPPAGRPSVALRVDLSGAGCSARYVDAAGQLVDTPVFQDSASWGTVLVHDRAIVPATSYAVEAIVPPATVVGSGTDTTWAWGDVDDDGDVNLYDLLCVLDGANGIFTSCALEAVDLVGTTPDEFVPDGVVDTNDVDAVFDAFAASPYPDGTPCAGSLGPVVPERAAGVLRHETTAEKPPPPRQVVPSRGTRSAGRSGR
jgi:hypothetical protein